MSLLEREIELKYLRKVLERAEDRFSLEHYMSPVSKANLYAHMSSCDGNYSYEEEKRLKKEAEEWLNSEDSEEYRKLRDQVRSLENLINTLEDRQIEDILSKNNIKEQL